MGKKQHWYMIGQISDKMLRDLREQIRREKLAKRTDATAATRGESAAAPSAAHSPRGGARRPEGASETE
jgi:hypothetical protein